MDVESVRSMGFREVVAVLERALDPSVSLDVLEAAMHRLTELDALVRGAGAVPGAPGSAAAPARPPSALQAVSSPRANQSEASATPGTA